MSLPEAYVVARTERKEEGRDIAEGQVLQVLYGGLAGLATLSPNCRTKARRRSRHVR